MQDRELEKVGRYMVHIAPMDDFRTLQHSVSNVMSMAHIFNDN